MLDRIASTYKIVDGKCYIDGVLQGSTEPCDEKSVWIIMAVIAIVTLLLVLLAIVLFCLWVWMLVHLIKHEDIKARDVWLITMIASVVLGLFWLAAPVYYFAVKRPYDKGLARESSTPKQ